jgi:hypothetical protein
MGSDRSGDTPVFHPGHLLEPIFLEDFRILVVGTGDDIEIALGEFGGIVGKLENRFHKEMVGRGGIY